MTVIQGVAPVGRVSRAGLGGLPGGGAPSGRVSEFSGVTGDVVDVVIVERDGASGLVDGGTVDGGTVGDGTVDGNITGSVPYVVTGVDWVSAFLAGGVSAGAAIMAGTALMPAGFTIPSALWPALVILTFGLGALARLDVLTHLIRDRHTAVLAAVTVPAVVWAAWSGVTVYGFPYWAVALAAAVFAFVFLLGVAMVAGFVGGGDIKLSPLPAAVLAGTGLMTPFVWFFLTFGFALIAFLVLKATGSQVKRAPLGPFMALAAILATPAGAWVTSLMVGGPV